MLLFKRAVRTTHRRMTRTNHRHHLRIHKRPFLTSLIRPYSHRQPPQRHRHTLFPSLHLSLFQHSKYRSSNEILMRSISEDSKKPVSHLTFGELFEHTKIARHDPSYSISTLNPHQFLVQSGEFARNEMAPRMAKLIMCLKNLPYGVSDTESMQSVLADYISSYQEVKGIAKISNIDGVHHFSEWCKYLLLKFLLTVPKLSYGLLQKATQPDTTFSVETCPYLNDFIDEFAEQRIGLRVLTGHFIALYDQIMEHQKHANDQENGSRSYKVTGLFDDNCDVVKYVENAIIDAKADCFQNFGKMPNVKIHDKRRQRPDGKSFLYIPEHLHHMVFELLKNSMRAVMEFHGGELDASGTDIEIIVVNNASDGSITIKISDIGGGIPRENLEKIWLYSYTTAFNLDHLTQNEKMMKQRELLGKVIQSAEKEWQFNSSDVCDINAFQKRTHDQQGVNVNRAVLGAVKYTPMFGLGYGLPIVRVYAQYFGGSCKIQSINGYGTDAYLYLNNLEGSNVRVI